MVCIGAKLASRHVFEWIMVKAPDKQTHSVRPPPLNWYILNEETVYIADVTEDEIPNIAYIILSIGWLTMKVQIDIANTEFAD